MSAENIPFVHLGARSEASVGLSIARVEELCWEASRDEQGLLALTDENSLSRIPAFAIAAARAGLRPIFGVVLNVLPTGEGSYRGVTHRMRIFVENITGWKTLVRLVNEARGAETATRPPHIPMARLLEDTRGLVYTSCGTGGEIQSLLANGNLEAVEAVLSEWLERIPVENLHLEIPPPGEATQQPIANLVQQVAIAFGIGSLVVPDIRAAHAADELVHAFVTGVVPAKRPDGAPSRVQDLLDAVQPRACLMSRKLVADVYTGHEQAMAQTLLIAERCANFVLPQPDRRFPIHDFTRGVDAESFIWNTAFSAATQRYGDLPTRYKERLNREFHEIVDAGLANAVVSMVRLHEELEEISVQRGPGAGLFTNSVVASLLGLTRIDPLQFDLNFELSPGLATGPFPLLELSVPANQQIKAVMALQKLFDGQVVPVGEWLTWKPSTLMEQFAAALGKEPRWAVTTMKQPSFQRARDAAKSQTANWHPEARLSLESPEVLAWLVVRMDGRLRRLQVLEGVYTFSVDPLASVLPQRHVPISSGSTVMIPVSEWSSEELGRLRHGRLRFAHPPLLDLVGEATAFAQEQGDPDFSPEQMAADEPATYKLIREGRMAGIQPFEPPLVRRRLRQGQPADLHSLIRILTSGSENERKNPPDLANILLGHLCAAIKAHRPLAFYAAALSLSNGDARRTILLLEEARQRGYRIMPVDVNYSQWRWTPEKNALRPGLMIVRGMTAQAGNEILSKRRELHFADVNDLCQRTDRAVLKATQLRALAKAGALDGFGLTRQQAMDELDPLFNAHGSKRNQQQTPLIEADFFEGRTDWWNPQPTDLKGQTPEEVAKAAHEALEHEKDTVGYLLHQETTEAEIAYMASIQAKSVQRLVLKQNGQPMTIAGLIGPIQDDPAYPGAILTEVDGCLIRARGELADRLDAANLVGSQLLYTGILERESFQWRMELVSFSTVAEAMERSQSAGSVELDLSQVPEANLRPLLALLRQFSGPTPVVLKWLPAEPTWTLRRIAARKILLAPLMELGLNRLVGPENWTLHQKPKDDSQDKNPATAMGLPGWFNIPRLRNLLTVGR